MRIKPIDLENSNQLVQDYLDTQSEIHSFFDYRPSDADEKRLADLRERSFQRDKLVQVLHKMNIAWDAPRETLDQIERLKDGESVVVIGGQQAGLLTGPMYTVNKVISILKLAKEKEAGLNVPVIPVFWIAGEDHDYDEINHIFSRSDNKLYKHATTQQLYFKQPISSVEIDKEKTLQWIERAFHDLKETQHTKKLYESIASCLHESASYVDFFARLIFRLFPNQGLVLIDSAHPDVRCLEKEGFEKLIANQPAISKSVYETVQRLNQKGYALSLEAEEDDAHLFYHDSNNERILLKREGSHWIGKNDEVKLTTDELLRIAQSEPERLSNNVVTRPIMQELLFPTLAFVGGHGELSYWAALKGAFNAFDETFKVPPVLPRISMTYITGRIEKLLEARVVEPDDIINNGIEAKKLNWLMSQETPPVEQLFEGAKQGFDQHHKPLRQLAASISADLGEESEKNFQFIQNQLAYLEHRMMLKLEEKFANELAQYDEIGQQLKPNEVLQERVWNPLPLLNEYGTQFIDALLQEESLSFFHDHFLIYLD